MVWLALVSQASAAPAYTVAGVGAVADGPDGQPHWAGAELGAALPVLPRLELGLRALGGVHTAGAPVVAAAPGVRWFTADPMRTVLSLVGEVGGQFDGGATLRAAGGATLDLRSDKALRPRVEGRYAWTPGDTPVRLEVAVGARWQRRDPEPVPEPEPDPEALTFSEVQSDSMVWVPQPVCAWLEPEPANEAFAANAMRLDKIFEIDPRAIGVDSSAGGTAGGKAAEALASLVVSAWPGDRVTVGDEKVATDADGVYVDRRAEGELTVVVEGGGRRLQRDVALAVDHGLWVSAPRPDPLRIAFAVGSTALNSTARDLLQAYAELAGDTRFEVVGAASPEGNTEDNAQLANGRADAVVAILAELGVEAGRLSVAPPIAPDPDKPLPEQRFAELRPLVGGEP